MEFAVSDVLAEAPRGELRFGGALGADSVALLAVSDATRVVFVPFSAANAPHRAREITRDCADIVVEMRLAPTKRAYLDRNLAMLDGADRLVAFTDGRSTGGTAFTIRAAQRMAIEVTTVGVRAVGFEKNPRVLGFGADVFAVEPYVSRYKTRRPKGAETKWSDILPTMKIYKADAVDVDLLARRVARYMSDEHKLSDAQYIVPMPRRRTGLPSSLIELAKAACAPTLKNTRGPWLCSASGSLPV